MSDGKTCMSAQLISAPTLGRYVRERLADRSFRYSCNVCGHKGDPCRAPSAADDGARHHLAHEHPELGVVWS